MLFSFLSAAVGYKVFPGFINLKIVLPQFQHLLTKYMKGAFENK